MSLFTHAGTSLAPLLGQGGLSADAPHSRTLFPFYPLFSVTSKQFNREFYQTKSSGIDDVHTATIQGTVGESLSCSTRIRSTKQPVDPVRLVCLALS